MGRHNIIGRVTFIDVSRYIFIYIYKCIKIHFQTELTKRDACGEDGHEDEIFKLFVLRQCDACFPGMKFLSTVNGVERDEMNGKVLERKTRPDLIGFFKVKQ